MAEITNGQATKVPMIVGDGRVLGGGEESTAGWSSQRAGSGVAMTHSVASVVERARTTGSRRRRNAVSTGVQNLWVSWRGRGLI